MPQIGHRGKRHRFLLAPLGFAARVDAVAGRGLPADFTSRRCRFGKNLIAARATAPAAGAFNKRMRESMALNRQYRDPKQRYSRPSL
jgi:hypothetical protein